MKRADVIQGQRSQLICAIYSIGDTTYYSATKQDKTIYETFTNGNERCIYVKDSAYTDAASFKAAMQGVILYYELAEPIVTELDDDFNLDYEVWNGGTEEVLSDTPSAPLSAEIAYGFNAVGKLTELAERIDNIEEGGSSSNKQGVVSQILTYNPADNTYSVSNAVRGVIPSFFIDLVTEAGASFNAESGYFSLNGIDNIAYDEMRKIYNCRTGYGTNSLLAVYGKTYTARTNFAAFRGYGYSYSNHEPTTIYTKYLCGQNASITKFALCDEVALYVRVGSANNFDSFGSGAGVEYRSRIEEIIGVLDVTNLTGSNNFFYNGAYHAWLTSFKLKALKASIDLSGMPRLSEATILYMINNEKAASAITIKLHADAKAMADASQAIQSALASHTNIILGV